MRFLARSALLLLLAACATTEPGPAVPVARSQRITNLQRAAALPWMDAGRCAVQEASRPWPVVVERCFHALDARRIRFRDIERRCPVASADAASVETVVGICLLSQPELAVGAVLILGTVVVAVAIKEELDAHALRRHSPEDVKPPAETKPAPQDPVPNREPTPEPLEQDWIPPVPPTSPQRERRPDCTPHPVPHLGGNSLHNMCADRVPQNSFPGSDVLINGKHFDALQLATRTLWEVKTNTIETYNPYVRRTELQKQVDEGLHERKLAAACGYEFVIGVRTRTHQELLKRAAPELTVVLMTWC